MFWAALGALVLSFILFFLGWRAEATGRSADERAGSSYLYLAGLAAFILSVILWGVGLTVHALGY